VLGRERVSCEEHAEKKKEILKSQKEREKQRVKEVVGSGEK